MILVEIAEVVNDLVIGDEGSDEGAESVDTGNDQFQCLTPVT